MPFKDLKSKIKSLVDNAQNVEQTLLLICELLKLEIPYYDWVGFYFKNGDKN